jgi:DNA-binding beta-propeller fold protein YncE
LAVSDISAGKLVTTLPIGSGVDASAFDPATQLIFASNGDGTMTVVHEDTPDTYTVVETVPTGPGAKTMALDPATHRVYLGTAPSGQTSFTVIALDRK